MKSPALRLLGRLFLAAALLYVALGFAVVAVLSKPQRNFDTSKTPDSSD